MSIADKLVTIAENMQKVYDAGHTEGIDIRTVSFGTWHNGTSADTLITFEHGLGVKPRYVAIIADNISGIKSATLPDSIAAVICQADGLYNSVADEHYILTYLRCQTGSITQGSINAGGNRLLHGWDDRYVYVNSPANTYAWSPSDVSTYTMICVA